jgi:hypothetical protein
LVEIMYYTWGEDAVSKRLRYDGVSVNVVVRA